jgi:hypothetical protein
MVDDFYMTTTGDIALGTNGDIAPTASTWQSSGQQAYIRIMTDIGDYLLYPKLGANLSTMYGMPQSQATGDYGIQLIQSALAREGVFGTSNIQVSAVPIGPQIIRFDVYLTVGSQQQIKISLQQNLSLVS